MYVCVGMSSFKQTNSSSSSVYENLWPRLDIGLLRFSALSLRGYTSIPTGHAYGDCSRGLEYTYTEGKSLFSLGENKIIINK